MMAVAQEVLLPDDVQVGMITRFMDASIIQTGDTELELRIKRSPLARRGWTATWNPAVVPTVERMFEVFGTHTSFLMQPPRVADYTETNQSLRNTTTGLFVGDGATVVFQLTISRTLGTITGSKKVLHPIDPLTELRVAGVAKIEDTDFTVDYSTGLVTFISAPSAAATVIADFEYYTPVRWLSDQVETKIEIATGDEPPQFINSAALIEVFDE